MPRLPRALLAVLAACVATVALPATAAQASHSTVRVGIADAYASTFDNPQFQRLHVKRTRYIIKWNAMDDPAQLQQADAFMQAARRHHVDVLLHFSTDDYTPRAARLPSVSEYKQKVGALVDRYYAMGVREFGVWNEENDRTQPTYRSPSRAGDYFVALWRMLDDHDKCGSGVTSKCRIVALDLLDGRTKSQRANTRSYIQRFYRDLSRTYRKRARFVGIHNYSDTNRHSTGGTKNILRTVKHYVRNAAFWLTETGGVVKLCDTGDFTCRSSSPSSVKRAERRADGAVGWMFRLTKRYRRDIDRLYIYTWSGTDCTTRFDAGLVRQDGSRRPAWYEVYRQLRDSKILKP
jgi:hypothetical protein